MSVGVAEAMGETSVDEIVIRADQALYRAKEEGRNKIVRFESTMWDTEDY